MIARHAIQYDASGRVKGQSIRTRRDPGDTFAVPEGHAVKGFSALLDSEGRTLQQWVKTREAGVDPVWLAGQIREVFEGYAPSPIIAPPASTDDDLLTVYPIADAHLGMRAEEGETGVQNDLETSIERLRASMRNLVAKSPPSGTALILNLWDAFHVNDHKNMTPTSGHILDVASRFTPIVKAGVSIFRECTDLALTKHRRVIIKHLPGNHDLTAWLVLQIAAAVHYAENPRVHVDEDEADYYFLRFGRNLLGAHHGHRLRKPEEMAMCMATECREDWGETDHHWFLHGHLHHLIAKEVMGVRVECMRTISPPDAFAAGKYGSGRSLVSVTLHREHGEHGRDTINLPPITRRAKLADTGDLE